MVRTIHRTRPGGDVADPLGRRHLLVTWCGQHGARGYLGPRSTMVPAWGGCGLFTLDEGCSRNQT